jgi:BED zinc finger
MNPRKKSERSDDKNFIADCGTCKKTLSGNINNTSNFLKHIKVRGVCVYCMYAIAMIGLEL